MKHISALSVLFLLVLLCTSCTNSYDYSIANYSNNDTINRQEIMNGIDSSLNLLVDGLIEKDAGKLFSIFSKSKESGYVRMGEIYPSIKYAQNQYADVFEHTIDSTERKFTFNHKHYDILSVNSALLTALGVIEKVPTPLDDDYKPWEIAYTILWIRENTGWKAVNMHISWKRIN